MQLCGQLCQVSAPPDQGPLGHQAPVHRLAESTPTPHIPHGPYCWPDGRARGKALGSGWLRLAVTAHGCPWQRTVGSRDPWDKHLPRMSILLQDLGANSLWENKYTLKQNVKSLYILQDRDLEDTSCM